MILQAKEMEALKAEINMLRRKVTDAGKHFLVSLNLFCRGAMFIRLWCGDSPVPAGNLWIQFVINLLIV